MYRLLLSTLSLIILSTYSFSQESITTASIEVGKNGSVSTWQEYLSNEEVTIEYKFVTCDPEMGYDKEQVILKVTNHTANKLVLDWHMILYYNSECKTCDYPEEYAYKVVVQPNSTKEGDCSVYNEDYQLTIFSKFVDTKYKTNDMLTSFQLDNLILTEYAPN